MPRGALSQAGFVDVRVEAQKRWLFQRVVYCTVRRAAAQAGALGG